jgi:hypothetical protein
MTLDRAGIADGDGAHECTQGLRAGLLVFHQASQRIAVDYIGGYSAHYFGISNGHRLYFLSFGVGKPP